MVPGTPVRKVRKKAGKKAANRTAGEPVLLSGGNPQIPKADGGSPL